MTLYIGVGNPDRGDDGVGPWIAARLAEEGLRVLTQRGETTALLEAWAGADDVVVVDAMRSGEKPGTVRRIDVHNEALRASDFTGSTHAFGVAEAVELGRALDALPDRLIVYGVEGRCFDIGAPISDNVLAAARTLVQELTDA